MSRAVITGATGAIGTALVHELIQNDIDVVVICRKNSNRRDRIPQNEKVTVIEKDLSELLSIELTDVGEKQCDYFFHLAWQGTTGTARNDMYLQNENVRYTLDAIQLAKRLGCHLFVGAGSQAEYGRIEGRMNESTPAFPENGYGIAKFCAGQMGKKMAHQCGMRYIWVRICSVYGPNDGLQSMVISGIIKMLAGERASYTKGDQLWDYLYSKDAAKALVLLAENECDGVFCLAGGDSRPLKEYIYQIRNQIDPRLVLGIGDIPYSEKQVMNLQVDISKLRDETGFEPMYSFEEGIKETVEWVESNALAIRKS